MIVFEVALGCHYSVAAPRSRRWFVVPRYAEERGREPAKKTMAMRYHPCPHSFARLTQSGVRELPLPEGEHNGHGRGDSLRMPPASRETSPSPGLSLRRNGLNDPVVAPVGPERTKK